MVAHLHQPDIDGLARRRVTVDPDSHRHLDECELCLRRLIDEALQLDAAETDGQARAPKPEDVAGAASR